MSVQEGIERLRDETRRAGIDPKKGLGEELFLFASTLMPVVNVDLLIANGRGEFLLSWRDDPHCGTGWYFPGGCVRLGETLSERLQKTARAEAGVRVAYEPKPAWVFEIFTPEHRDGIADQHERSHFITLAYLCRVLEGTVQTVDEDPPKPGDLRWFSELPDNLLELQDCYRDNWPEISERIRRSNNGGMEE